ncbi:hypothetical protein ScPMuIL_004591 [Solemya velum]
MGQFASSFIMSESKAVSRYTQPDQANWITSHAIASELSIAEVERLWLRFQQLGCNDDGVITGEMLKTLPIRTDVIMRNIMQQFMSSTSRMITFENFIRALKFIEEADLETKIKGIFRLLNNGNPVHKDLLTRILERVYEEQGNDIKKLADTFFKEMDTDNKGQITEAKFVQAVKHIPAHILQDLLSFSILPNVMKQKLHNGVPEFGHGGPENSWDDQEYTAKEVPSDGTLKTISEKIKMRDWDRVANKLGFMADDIKNFKAKRGANKGQQVYQMLLTWKERDGDQQVLDQALRASGMTDAALVLTK